MDLMTILERSYYRHKEQFTSGVDKRVDEIYMIEYRLSQEGIKLKDCKYLINLLNDLSISEYEKDTYYPEIRITENYIKKGEIHD